MLPFVNQLHTPRKRQGPRWPKKPKPHWDSAVWVPNRSSPPATAPAPLPAPPPSRGDVGAVSRPRHRPVINIVREPSPQPETPRRPRSGSPATATRRLLGAGWRHLTEVARGTLDEYVLTLRKGDEVVWSLSSSETLGGSAMPLVQHSAPDDPLDVLQDEPSYHDVVEGVQGTFQRLVAHFQRKHDKVQREVDEVKARAEACGVGGTEYERLRKEKEELKEVCSFYRIKLKELRGVNSRCGEHIRTLEDQVDDLRKEGTTLQKQAYAERMKAEEARAHAHRLSESYEELLKANDDIKEVLYTCEKQLKTSKEWACMVEAERDAFRVEVSRLSGEKKALSENLSHLRNEYDQLLEEFVAMKQNVATSMSSHKPFFIGMGKSRTVPVYLRFSGKIRNLCITKADLEKLVREMWTTRIDGKSKRGRKPANLLVKRDMKWDHVDYGNIAVGSQNQGKEDFASYFAKYTAERWPKNTAEWCYSLLDSLERFSYDADMEIFLKVLRGLLPEDSYVDQVVMIQKLKLVLQKHDQNRLGQLATSEAEREQKRFAWVWKAAKLKRPSGEGLAPCGALKVDELLAACRSFFPAKTLENHKMLEVALQKEMAEYRRKHKGSPEVPPETVLWPLLFVEDAEGNQGVFVESLRDQHVEEVALYLADVKDAISATEIGGKVMVRDVRNAVLSVDPEKPAEDLDWLLECITGGAARPESRLDTSDVLCKVTNTFHKRFTLGTSRGKSFTGKSVRPLAL